VSDPYTQGRLQDIEKHVRSLDETVKVLASVDRPAVRKQIEQAFADPRVIIVYRGVQEGLTQPQIAGQLKARVLSNPTQSFVSGALANLHDRGFVDKAPKGAGYVAVEGWEKFNLKKTLRKMLKAAGVDDLA
jgi:hypothetical protein